MLSKRPPSTDEGFRFIKALLLLSHSPVQLLFLTTLRLAVVSTPMLVWQPSAPGRAVSAAILAMQQVARETRVAFERQFARTQVPAPQRPDFHEWTHFCFGFCSKYGHPQATCKPCAWEVLACCYGVVLVFSSYSLGVLLVFSSCFAPEVPDRHWGHPDSPIQPVLAFDSVRFNLIQTES